MSYFDLPDIIEYPDGKEPDTRKIALELPTEIASSLERAACTERKTVGELVALMLADYRNR